MTFYPNQDLKSFHPVPRWRYLARDFVSAVIVASVILGAIAARWFN